MLALCDETLDNNEEKEGLQAGPGGDCEVFCDVDEQGAADIRNECGVNAATSSHEPEVARKGRKSRASGVQYIKKSNTGYQACLTIFPLYVWSRFVRDLQTALDHLVLIIAIKSRVASCAPIEFPVTFKQAVLDVLEENGIIKSELGLRYCILVLNKLLLSKAKIVLPCVQNLDKVVRILAMYVPVLPLHRHRGRCSIIQLAAVLEEKQKLWPQLRSTLLKIVHVVGQCTDSWEKHLDALHASTEPDRMKLMELWNRRVMAKEEKRQLKYDAEQRRLQRNEARQAKRQRAEDREARRQQLLEMKVDSNLRRWRSAKREIEAKKRVEDRVKERKALALRKERWRQMTRRDITMDEILRSNSTS
eukprot:TRINITY_DN25684_c0_g2_i1.p1 TRINITY_DN25684_c0_g2~~TRINITY_DN25684_c0_g2_i1.p1  ORF type:complete len:369 (+),score=57.61 TRINITY_DN25684_c0_g2_i1:24-1109(+)